jgi:hypothetical protein
MQEIGVEHAVVRHHAPLVQVIGLSHQTWEGEMAIKAGRVQCQGAESRGWSAWNNVMPIEPPSVHVRGEVLVANIGVEVTLTYREPQGFVGSHLLLDLHLFQREMPDIDPTAWKPASYHGPLEAGVLYTDCTIFCENDPFVTMPVTTAGLAAPMSAPSANSFRATRQGGPGADARTVSGENPFPWARGWSGENPFPWSPLRNGESPFPWFAFSKRPICLSGSVSDIGLDSCMEGATHYLTMSGGIPKLRLLPASDEIKKQLAGFSGTRVIVTVCGHMQKGIEGGCFYLNTQSVSTSDQFATAMNLA